MVCVVFSVSFRGSGGGVRAGGVRASMYVGLGDATIIMVASKGNEYAQMPVLISQ